MNASAKRARVRSQTPSSGDDAGLAQVDSKDLQVPVSEGRQSTPSVRPLPMMAGAENDKVNL